MSLFYLNKSQSLPGRKKCSAADYRMEMEDELTADAALRDELWSNISCGKLLIAAIKHVSTIYSEMIRIDEGFSDALVSSGLIEKGSGEAAGHKVPVEAKTQKTLDKWRSNHEKYDGFVTEGMKPSTALNKKRKGLCQKFEFSCPGVGGSFGCAERL